MSLRSSSHTNVHVLRKMGLWPTALPSHAIRARNQRLHIHFNVDFYSHRPILRHHLPFPSKDEAEHMHFYNSFHLAIFISGDLSVWSFHGTVNHKEQNIL